MTYAKYATGFKGGGFSPRPATALQTDPFDPEYLKTFEIGAKSEFAQRRVRLNGAVFVSSYEDQQTFAQQLDASGANWFREINAGKADIWGIELELLAEPVPNLRIEGSFGYLDYELVDNEGNTLLLEGRRVRRRPLLFAAHTGVTGALGMQYGFGMAEGGSITPRRSCRVSVEDLLHHQQPGPAGGYTILECTVAVGLTGRTSGTWRFMART